MGTTMSAPIPEGVTVTIKARKVTVKGPLGELKRDLSHCHADIRVEDGKVVVESWFTATKQKSALKSALSRRQPHERCAAEVQEAHAPCLQPFPHQRDD